MSRVLITQMQMRYQTKAFFMLYKNGLALSYEKLQSRGRKWPKRMLEAAILENGGYRYPATLSQLAPSKIIIYTFIRLQRYITLYFFIKTATTEYFGTGCPSTNIGISAIVLNHTASRK